MKYVHEGIIIAPLQQFLYSLIMIFLEVASHPNSKEKN